MRRRNSIKVEVENVINDSMVQMRKEGCAVYLGKVDVQVTKNTIDIKVVFVSDYIKDATLHAHYMYDACFDMDEFILNTSVDINQKFINAAKTYSSANKTMVKFYKAA